ncbi:MAG: flavodoxin family protein [Clostridia bacterium]|nr:flavodoxin family protein [Clostridia bacterium]
MKVLMINGSPHEAGCTYTALTEVAKPLTDAGIEVEIVHIGKKPIGGCTACGGCKTLRKCVFDDGLIASIAEKMAQADALIVGSPVYYASPNGSLIGLLDRLWMTAGAAALRHKPAAAVVSARRAGTTASLEVLYKYFAFAEMPIVSSQYWNMVHGSRAEDVAVDVEGVQIMRRLGQNMAWMLRSLEAARAAGIEPPKAEPRVSFNYIR